MKLWTESMTADQVEDLAQRLGRAIDTLRGQSNQAQTDAESWRLFGKAQGVMLAIDYMRNYQK